MADLKTLVEAFGTARANVSAVQANSQFTLSYAPTATDINFASGVGNIANKTSYANGLQTSRDWSWDGTGIYLKPTAAPTISGATAMETFIAISDGTATDDSIRMAFNINTASGVNTITPVLYNVDNTYSNVSGIAAATYVPGSTHAWLGFSYDATTLHWWRSANGTTWTEFGTGATKPAWVSKSTLTFSVSINRVGGSSSPNTTVDNVNINGTSPYTPPAGGGGTNKGAGFMLLLGG